MNSFIYDYQIIINILNVFIEYFVIKEKIASLFH